MRVRFLSKWGSDNLCIYVKLAERQRQIPFDFRCGSSPGLPLWGIIVIVFILIIVVVIIIIIVVFAWGLLFPGLPSLLGLFLGRWFSLRSVNRSETTEAIGKDQRVLDRGALIVAGNTAMAFKYERKCTALQHKQLSCAVPWSNI